MIAATLFSGSRSSSSRTGLNSAAASAATAASRSNAPRWRNHRPTSASKASGTTMAAISGQESRGSSENDQFILLPQPLEQVRNVDLVGFVIAGQHIHQDVD